MKNNSIWFIRSGKCFQGAYNLIEKTIMKYQETTKSIYFSRCINILGIYIERERPKTAGIGKISQSK